MAWWTGSLPRSLTGLLLIAHGALLTTVVAEPQVVSLPLYRNAHRSLAKRDTVTAALSNDYSDGMFWVNATVGTPGQPVQLQIDTGSSDIWMMGEYACIEISTGCIGGSYDELSSSTVSILEHGGFTIGYLDGSGVMGDYIRDDFAIGGVTVKGMTLAVATQVKDIGTGVMGIGFESDESIAAQGGQPYRNLVSHMVGQGLIKSRSYSLWLNDINAQTGNILFGGYDTAKFHGDLVAMKVQPDAQSGQITSMTVAWTSLAVNDPTHGTKVLTPKSFALPAVLDSGTTLTYVPQDLYDELASFANVVTDAPTGIDFVDCDAVNQYNGTLDFGFAGPNGPVISVLFSEMAIPVKDANGKQQKLENGSPACHFGLSPAPENEILLGDTFLRSAYVVYDLERKEIAIAKTNFNSDRSNIVEIAPKNSTATPTWKFVDSVTVVQTMTVVPGQPGQLGSLALASTHSYTQTDIGFHIPTATGKHNAAGSVRMVDSGILSSVVLGVFSALAGAGFLFVR